MAFVHIGDQLPPYIETALSQARLFNPECKIYLIANKNAVTAYKESFEKLNIKTVHCEDLKPSKYHKKFLSGTPYKCALGRYSSERFFLLDELMSKYKLKNVFHLESDVLIYFDIKDQFNVFKARYKGIAATFDNEERCIPGFLYFAKRKALHQMVKFFADHAHEGHLDMQMIGFFKKTTTPKVIDNLPIIPEAYTKTNTLMSLSKKVATNPSVFYKNYSLFRSIFDAAAIGQYLGGCDKMHNVGPGFINEDCVFNPSILKYTWEKDTEGRTVPYACFGNQKCRINNLHIHCKDLHLFISNKPAEAE